MKLSSFFHRRTVRLLVVVGLACAGIVATASAWTAIGVAAGLSVGFLALGLVLATKAVLELVSDVGATNARVEANAEANRKAIATSAADASRRIADSGSLIEAMMDQIAALEAALDLLEQVEAGNSSTAHSLISDVESELRTTSIEAAKQRQEIETALSQIERRLSRTAADLERSASTQRRTSGLLRTDLDELGRHMVDPISATEAERLADTDVLNPLLSIAIPGFNRTEHLGRCLQSLVDEIEAHGITNVEIHITDDVSTAPGTTELARDFARRYSYIGLHMNERNLGLEHNLIQCTTPCRGEFLLIMGNDDSIVPGALKMLLEDLEGEPCPVLLYEKTRVGSDGVTAIPPIAGPSPIEIPAGASHRFDSLLEAIQVSGLISSFGFISQVVVRRVDFTSVDASVYLGLTTYPQLGVLCEAFLEKSVCYRNAPLVHHRTISREDKFAEAVGRGEESFMAGGEEQRATNFGRSLGAQMQRIVDRSALTHADVARLPERLLTKQLLWEWIEENVRIADDLGVQFDSAVVEDYERLRTGMQRLTA
ncbi:MAG: glycosyltransferase family 2 protein [Acidimicrobiia bacterium]